MSAQGQAVGTWHPGRICVAASLLAVAAFLVGFTDSFETPPEQDPVAVLGPQASGATYRVLAPVRGDGFLRLYDVETGFGLMRVAGDGLLRNRLKELAALAALDQLGRQERFVEGLRQAALRPAEFVYGTVIDPLAAARGTVSGVGRLFDRISSGVGRAVTGDVGSPGEIARGLTGQARARRQLAVELGVDPYTDFAPLSARLDEASAVSAAGSLTVTALLALIPAGLAAPRPEAALTPLTERILDSSRDELERRTAADLAGLGIPGPVVAALAANRHYTPMERAVLADRLQALAGVDGLTLLAEHMAGVETREEAWFQLRRAVMLAQDHEARPLAEIRHIAGFPVGLAADGGAALVFPLDMVAWTASSARALQALNEGLAAIGIPGKDIAFVVSGEITPLAAERLAANGWRLQPGTPLPDGSPVD
ncbi:hypothetical protein [Polymorphum gilvum]|uniref:Uncharacterized protein n=1 Tax=Polymorphum gilvum (strain LMG 25793 / CGMCC 1.9160 / SL003B-26A1) TaxID=991905 RepID=F2IYH3_POLGS|nr:hypothetical protein [Polymorphum gilvum]ADZ68486.1 hypothetical protein SL003B_0047 [Polymorphum gilvum SL003B-26A1]